MKAGNTNLDVNTRVKIVKGDFKGLTGRATHPFGAFPEGQIGIYLDNGWQGISGMNICNADLDEIEII